MEKGKKNPLSGASHTRIAPKTVVGKRNPGDDCNIALVLSVERERLFTKEETETVDRQRAQRARKVVRFSRFHRRTVRTVSYLHTTRVGERARVSGSDSLKWQESQLLLK